MAAASASARPIDGQLHCGAELNVETRFASWCQPQVAGDGRLIRPAGRPASDDPIPIRTHGGAGGLIGGRTGEPPVDVHEQ